MEIQHLYGLPVIRIIINKATYDFCYLFECTSKLCVFFSLFFLLYFLFYSKYILVLIREEQAIVSRIAGTADNNGQF